MRPAETKASRLLQIEQLLLAHPEGLTQAELARRLGVHRSTICRNLCDLLSPTYESGGRLFIDRQACLVDVRLNLNEALALHLAARLLAANTDRRNPHAASAVRKMGHAIRGLGPPLGAHLQQSADEMDCSTQREDPAYLAVLETLTQAWAEQRLARVWRRQSNGGQGEYRFGVYFMEPYAAGRATHAIGWRDPPGGLRTFKVERIERAELLDERYQIPPGFTPQALLAEAWGIWFTGEPPEAVALRFSPVVARRVRETCWHPAERVEGLPGGGLLWRAQIAAPREMVPWIRGWGADVEVLEPPWLRLELQAEAEQLGRLYGGEGGMNG